MQRIPFISKTIDKFISYRLHRINNSLGGDVSRELLNSLKIVITTNMGFIRTISRMREISKVYRNLCERKDSRIVFEKKIIFILLRVLVE